MIFKTVQIQKCVGYILPENIFVIKNGKKVKLSKGTKINQQIKNILVSNGFKQRANHSYVNHSGDHIFMAFGQSMVGSNNIPATAR